MKQGFTTRQGGVSPRPLDSLNMSTNVGDDPELVAQNRRRATTAVGAPQWPCIAAGQVHGSEIAVVDDASPALVEGVDALITLRSEVLLLMLFADCVPVFFCDPIRRAVGLAHSGWKGTAQNVAGKTARRMLDEFECDSETFYAAIGPSIGSDHYEVDLEVVSALTKSWPGGSASPLTPRNEFDSKWLVNLRLIVFDQLVAAGVRPEKIAVCDECTFSNRRDFFSHRRDSAKNGTTGRMAGMIGIAKRGAPMQWPAG